MASFAVVEEDQLMLVTNMGQVIRIRVHGSEGDSIRIASRKTQGVRLFDVADDVGESCARHVWAASKGMRQRGFVFTKPTRL